MDETPNSVIRVLTFRDEWEGEWTQFIRNPVRQILQAMPELRFKDNLEPFIIDLWDRQFVTLRLEKTTAPLAQVFIVTMRIGTTDLQPFMNHCGKSGIYIEPRNEEGRRPASEFRVVWLPQQDKGSLQAIVQTARDWCCLARTGQKFGLRTTEDRAEALHQQFKPSTPWIESQALQSFTVGPFPPGSTRAAIIKKCKAWEWNAKPVQPKARSADGKGVLWHLLAAQAPDSEVYQLQHGDVLVTPDPPKKGNAAFQPYDVQASAKTIAALTTPTKHAKEEADPWAAQDPWSTPSKFAKPSPQQQVTKHDMTSMEQRIEQRIKATLSKTEGEDVMMAADDDRVGQLEQRLNKMETSLQHHQQTTANQHNDTLQQLHQVRSQVEQHHATVHQLLDQRFTEQLGEIERIMAKRPKTNE